MGRSAPVLLAFPSRGRRTAPAVDRVLSLMAYLRRSPSLFFIPLVPYPPLRGTFPSRGRLCVEDSVVLVSQPSPLGKGDRVSGARVLSLIVDLRCISPLIFHTASTLSGSLRSPPSPRGEGFVRPYCFSTYACIRSDDARKAVFSFRSLPHWGRWTALAVDRVLSYIVDLRRISPLFFIPLVPYPPLRGTFPSRGRLCVEDSVVLVSQPSPLGKGDRAAVDRVLS